MAGIYLHFNPEGISPAEREDFSKRLSTRTTCMPSGAVDQTENRFWVGASIHHGYLPTGGTASVTGAQLLVSGSCWGQPSDVTLASPGDLLEIFNSQPPNVRSAIGGTFSLAFCDEVKRELTVETDRFATMPLYYRRRGGGIQVSSEMKFLAEPGGDAVDENGLAEYMAFGYMIGSQTLLAGVSSIPTNARLIFGDQGLQISLFSTSEFTRDRVVDEETITEYDSMVKKYLQRFKGHAASHSISLSGGLDSRVLAAVALEEGFPMTAFTVGEEGSLDARWACKVADNFGIPIKVHNVDGSLLPRYLRKTVWFTEGRVPLGHMHYMSANLLGEVPGGPQFHGLVGEAVLGGHFDDPALQDESPDVIRDACIKSASGLNYLSPARRLELYSADLLSKVKSAKQNAVEGLFDHMGFSGTYSDYVDFRERFRMLAFADPCIMGQVLPWTDVICPFFDREAYDFGASLELEGIAHRRGQVKWGLQHYPSITDLPRIKAGVMVDVLDEDPHAYDRGARKLMWESQIKYYICRLSQGRINLPIRKSFPYYGQWYRRWSSVRDFVNGILLSEQTLDRGLFRRKGIKNLLNDCRVGRDTWGIIGTLLITEIFLRQMTEGTDIPENPRVPLGLEK